MEEKPVAPAAGNHRRASREAEKVLPARALDARRLPERALAVRVPRVRAAVARARRANPAEEKPSALLLHANPGEASFLFPVVRTWAALHLEYRNARSPSPSVSAV